MTGTLFGCIILDFFFIFGENLKALNKKIMSGQPTVSQNSVFLTPRNQLNKPRLAPVLSNQIHCIFMLNVIQYEYWNSSSEECIKCVRLVPSTCSGSVSRWMPQNGSGCPPPKIKLYNLTRPINSGLMRLTLRLYTVEQQLLRSSVCPSTHPSRFDSSFKPKLAVWNSVVAACYLGSRCHFDTS